MQALAKQEPWFCEIMGSHTVCRHENRITVTPVGSAWDIGGRINEVKLYAYVTSMQKHVLI
jgi:hypothetical protein